MVEWAEGHLWLTHGDRTVPFRVRNQPVTGVFLDLWGSGRYSTALGTGPSQAAKTTGMFTIPSSYYACVLRENQVHGIPLDEMVNDKYGELFSIWRQSPKLRPHVPANHREGRGGKIRDKQTTPFGAELRPMTKNGGDAARAGYPARLVNITEGKEFSSQISTSVEANTYRQLLARMRSFDYERRRLIIEGTSGEDWQLPWSERGDDPEKPLSTMTRLLAPCPHCHEGISPDREHLVGWQDAATESEAIERARFLCPLCRGEIDDHQRRAMVRLLVPVHAGQTYDKEHGEAVGPHPPTRVLWFAYTAFHNLLIGQGNLGKDEWEAAQVEEGTEAHDNRERELCQFVWARCFKSTLVKEQPLTAKDLRSNKRRGQWARNICPPDTQTLTLGVDLGDWTGWWLALASREHGERAVVAWGAFDVKRSKQDDVEQRTEAAIEELIDAVLLPGLNQEGASVLRPFDRGWIDINHNTDAAVRGVRSQGSIKSLLRACRGAGRDRRNAFRGGNSSYRHPSKRTRMIRRYGDQWYEELNSARRLLEYTFNSDHYKKLAHDGLKADAGSPGSIVLPFSTDPSEQLKLTRQLAAEVLETTWKPRKGVTEEYVRHGQQHWLDCLAMALAAANEVGYKPASRKLNWGSLR